MDVLGHIPFPHIQNNAILTIKLKMVEIGASEKKM